MAVTNYYTVEGEILGEKTTASSRIDYLTDALGSVTATLNQSAQVVNTYRYKPYGAQLAKSGVGADPAFTWVGAQGYRQTGRKYSDVYVHARHYSTLLTLWSTQDPMWPAEAAFAYALNNPITNVDPSGLSPVRIGPVPPNKVGCDGDQAVTDCNFKVGKPYTIICDLACDAPCTDAHEGQHRHDVASCCAMSKKCVDAARTPAQIQLCKDKWYKWLNEERSRTECQAYRSGRACRERMVQSQHCLSESQQGHCTPCCKALFAAIDRDNDLIHQNCSGAGWPRPTPATCPFS